MQKKTNFAIVVEIIQQLLLENNCVIVPNFGAFIGNYQPAIIQLSNHTIFPPNKIILFNRILQTNDGILVNAVAKKYTISYEAALEKVNDFVKDCQQTIQNNRSLILKEIGRFTLDAENNLQFQPNTNKNLLLDSFGLPTMSLEPIARLKDSVADIESTTHAIKIEQLISRTNKIKKYSFAAILVGILILGSVIFYNNSSNIFQNEASVMSVFDTAPAKMNTKIIDTTPKAVESIAQTTETNTVVESEPIVSAPIETPTKNTIVNNKKVAKAYIVIGAFFDQVRAEKLKEEAISKGFNANISKDAKLGLYRTTVQTSQSAVDADLKQIQTEINPRAWIFCVKCNLN